jgi:hypothetical protein
MGIFKTSIFKKAGSYLMELLIVVVGVSIAFQLNVWNDERKSAETENHMLQNFISENSLNKVEIDSTLMNIDYTLEANPYLIKLLQLQDPDMDSVRIIMARLYSISWPDFTSTHLSSYLEYESGTSLLKEEMLVLKTYYASSDELIEVYIQQKQEKYFDFLSDAVDMTDGLKVIDKEKLLNVKFRNNLLIIYFYEKSLQETFEKIKVSQDKVTVLIYEHLDK